jgi:predicted amidohydrolase
VHDLKLSLIQQELHWHDPAANRDMFARIIAEQAAGSDLIVLPETFTTGFTMQAEGNDEPVGGTTTRWLLTLAAEYDAAICGSLIIREDAHYYNRLIWAQPDGSVYTYDKRHLFHMGGEDKPFTRGRRRLIVSFRGWRICPLICYDLRFPGWSRGRNDYDLLLYVANWPATRKSAWETLLPARAVENLCYTAGVNRTGTDGTGKEYAGGSVITDYLGTRLMTGGTGNEVLRLTLSGDKLVRYREKFPAWKDADEFHIEGQ